MSNKNRSVSRPLPVVGATGWGSTLNSYLMNQHYETQELYDELNNIYDNQLNATQTILSSGVIPMASEDNSLPGLYDKDGVRVGEGDKLSTNATDIYTFKGNVAIVANNSFSGQPGGSSTPLEIKFNDTGITDTPDARCLYICRNRESGEWSYAFGATENPETETSISLDPFKICIGVCFKIGSGLYWHYKMMKSNLSISSKRWMLDEPHARLDTYFNLNSGVLTAASNGSSKAILSIQALGINPMSTTEGVTAEVDADQENIDIATKSGNNMAWNAKILNKDDGSFYDMGESLNLTDGCVYRLSATALVAKVPNGTGDGVINTPIMLLQQAVTTGATPGQSLYNDDDYNRLYYYADPVELYNIKDNVMTASVGNGISTINANGINPHITTVIKNADDVRFGEGEADCFHFNTSSNLYGKKLGVLIPYSESNESVVLTNNMSGIERNIKLCSGQYKRDTDPDTSSYATLDLIEDKTALGLDQGQSTRSGGLVLLQKDGKLDLYSYKDATSYNSFDYEITGGNQANIGLVAKNSSDKSEINTSSDYLNMTTNEKTTIITPQLVLNYGENDKNKDYAILSYDGTGNPSFILGSSADQKIKLTADGGKACIEIGTPGGVCSKLSPNGLYLPSGSEGVRIDKIEGGAGKPLEMFIDCTGEELIPSLMDNYDYIDNLPGIRDYLEDYELNPVKTPDLDDPEDTARNGISSVVVELYKTGAKLPQTVNLRYTANNEWSYTSDGKSVVVTFNGYITKIRTSPKNAFSKIEGIKVKFSFTAMDGYPSLDVGQMNSTFGWVDAVNEDSLLWIRDNRDKGSIYTENNVGSILIKKNTGTTTVNSNTGTTKIPSNEGNLTVNNNDGTIHIKHNNEEGGIAISSNIGSIVVNDKFKIYDNICYYNNNIIDYSKAIETLRESQIYKDNLNTMWSIYGFDRQQNCITPNESGNFGGVVWSNAWGEEWATKKTFYTFLPDLGVYKVILELFDKGQKKKNTEVWYPTGDMDYNNSGYINLLTANYTTKLTDSDGNTDYYCKVVEGDFEGGAPDIYINTYLEYDRVCVKFVINTWGSGVSGRKDWGCRLLLLRDYNSDYPYYIKPVCQFKE